jgi:hypothetical protein
MTTIGNAVLNRKRPVGLPRNGRDRPAIQQFCHHIYLVVVSPNGAPGCFSATVNDRLMVLSSRQPLLDACRALLAEGVDSNAWVIMRHAGSPTDALRTKVGIAAKLTVAEGDRGVPRFRSWKPMQLREGSPPVHFPAPARATTRARSGC